MAAETPKPMSFAIMRNAHEALRSSIRRARGRLDASDVSGMRGEWGNFRRALAVHMRMEDDFMFDLLDEVGAGAITAAGLPEEHTTDSDLARDVDAALNRTPPDLAALRATWEAWETDHLHHLEHEEAVMMPLTVKTAPTPESRSRVVHDRLLSPSEAIPDFDWFIGWVVGLLNQYGSSEQPPEVAVRVFAWGLQQACSPAQWARLSPVVRANCSPAIWQMMVEKVQIDAPGPIAD
jgi:hemerythrin-like domain-containing protein